MENITQIDIEEKDESFICQGCGQELNVVFQMRTMDFCYICDPNVTVEELLND
jgi:predicted RNA-binding Zn-ribbon protein involved in translation (DUF1610 family)